MANSLGVKAHFHVMGDRAMEIMLDAVEAARDAGYNDVRNVVTHMQVFNNDQAARMHSRSTVLIPWMTRIPGEA